MANWGRNQRKQMGDDDSSGNNNNYKESSPSTVTHQNAGGSRGNASFLDNSPVLRQQPNKNYSKHQSVTVSENMRDLIAFKLRNSLMNPPPAIINPPQQVNMENMSEVDLNQFGEHHQTLIKIVSISSLKAFINLSLNNPCVEIGSRTHPHPK